MNVPTLWTEKYRPSSIRDVVGQTAMQDIVRHMFDDSAGKPKREKKLQGNFFTGGVDHHEYMVTLGGVPDRELARWIASPTPVAFCPQKRDAFLSYLPPHLLLYGSSGTGKTSSLLSVCRDLFGTELLPDRMLHINASYDRGIQTVRDQLKTFAARSLCSKPSGYAYPCPPFKVAILEEADRLTVDAQCALRRIIEQYGDRTRFCFVCNKVGMIIDPIASRCQRIYFARIDRRVMVELLQRVAASEHVSYAEPDLLAIADAADGDIRKALNVIQAACVAEAGTVRLDSASVTDITGYALPSHIDAVMRFAHGTSADRALDVAQEIVHEGVVVLEGARQLLDACLEDRSISDDRLHESIEALFDLRRQTSCGADSALALANAMHRMRL
jgi:replication factor C subunit 2/4